jgi:hypothetical protein
VALGSSLNPNCKPRGSAARRSPAVRRRATVGRVARGSVGSPQKQNLFRTRQIASVIQSLALRNLPAVVGLWILE